MDIINICIAIVGTINLILGSFIFLRNKRSKVNVSFLILSVSISCWCLTMFFFRSTSYSNAAEFWCRMLYISAILIAGSFLYLTSVFPDGKFGNLTKKIFFGIITVTLILACFVPGIIIQEVQIIQSGENVILFSYPFYIFYIVYIVGVFNWGFVILFKKFFASSGIERQQFKFMIFGDAIATVVGVITNLILPTIGFFSLNWLGQVFSITMVAFIAYAIIKHHLLDVKMIATEIFLALIVITLLIDALLARATTEKTIKFVIFLIMLFFSYLLMRSILKEIKTKDQLEKTAKELKKANMELKELDKSKSEFISIASHQLLTPLTPIRGYSSMMIDGDYGNISKEQKGVLKMIHESSVRLVNMVSGLLDISRIERGTLEYNFEPVDISEIIENSVKELTPRAKEKKLSLEFKKSDEKIPNINADKDRLKEVMLNLIDNSIKYTPGGKIEVSAEKKSDDVIISVRDEGIGLRQVDFSKLFKKFSRSDAVKGIHVDGSGLGLYVAKKHIEAHKGKIWAESEGQNKGSVFFVSLPVNKRR